MDAYYLLREQDRVLQTICMYEEDNDIDDDKIVEYVDRKHACIRDILRLLKELGLPTKELMAYAKENSIIRNQKQNLVSQQTGLDRDTGSAETKSPSQRRRATFKQSKTIGVEYLNPIYLLDEIEVNSMIKYGFYRPEETKIEKTRLPSQAELKIIVYKTYFQAENEQREAELQMALRRKVKQSKSLKVKDKSDLNLKTDRSKSSNSKAHKDKAKDQQNIKTDDKQLKTDESLKIFQNLRTEEESKDGK